MRSRKALFLLVTLTFLLFTSSLFSSDFRIWNPKDGLPVRQGHHIEFYRSVETDANGNMCVVWSDARSGDQDIYAQLINSDGEMLWRDTGKLIVSEVNRQEDPHVFPDGNGNWIISWIDYRMDLDCRNIGEPYIQKIDGNGDPMWEPTSGVRLSNGEGRKLHTQSYPDGEGGALTLWSNLVDYQVDLFSQRTDSNGNILWEENGRIIADGTGNQGGFISDYYSAVPDNDGGIIFAYTDNRGDIYCNRIAASGDLLWADSTGVPVCTEEAEQSDVRITLDGNNGAFLIWKDHRGLTTTSTDIYGQYVDANGTVAWETNGAPISNSIASQMDARIISSGINEAIVVWSENSISREGEMDIKSQKISNTNGSRELHWGNVLSGNQVCDAFGNQFLARIASDQNGGVYVSWIDERLLSYPTQAIYAQHFNSDGNPTWGESNGIIVSDKPLSKRNNILVPLSSNKVGVIWSDYLHGSPAIYQQIFEINGDRVLEEDGQEIIFGISNDAMNSMIIPSTGNRHFVIWSDYRQGFIGSNLYWQGVDFQTGEIQEAVNGASITPGYPYSGSDTSFTDFRSITTVSDGNNGVLCAWAHSINNSTFRYINIQKIDASGNVLWGNRGTPVAYDSENDTYVQDNPSVLPTDDGGAVVIYNQYSDLWYLTLRAQRLDSNGEGLWSSDDGSGYLVVSDADHDFTILSANEFNDGSILVVFRKHPLEGIYAQRILLSGENAWEEPIAISETDHAQFSAKTLKIEDEILIVWEDERRGNHIVDIYGQIISLDGTLSLTTNGLALVEEENQQGEIYLEKDGNYFWMAWKDSGDENTSDLYIQKYSLDCTPQFTPPGGIQIGLDEDRQYNPVLVSDGVRGMYVVWDNYPPEKLSDVMYTHLNEDGNPINNDYIEEGLPLGNANYRQNISMAVPDGVGGFFAVWHDDRSTGKEDISNVYMQRVNDWIVSVNNTPDIQPVGWALENAYPNPFNPSTKIAFEVGTTSNVKLTVYDILGREVVKLVNSTRQAGSHSVLWNGQNSAGSKVASGAYYYRLEADDVLITKRMVLVK